MSLLSHKMEDKVVLITGSSAGIGRASAIEFAKQGCKVVVHGTDVARTKQVASECQLNSPKQHKPLEIVGDLRNQNVIENLIEQTVKTFGGLDVLVNNAGLFQPCSADAANAQEVFTSTMDINLNTAVKLTLLAIPHLKKSKGCIVNISSNLHAKCIDGGFAYCTAKAALTMFTKTIAVDLAPDVRANSVSPGPVATLMSTRCGMDEASFRAAVGGACLVERVGEPEEVARLVLFLASPQSSFITGSDYIIDGGSTIKPEAGKVMGRD